MGHPAEDLSPASVSSYGDVTDPSALVTNIETNVSAEEAAANLQANGFSATSLSDDGQATTYTNANGDEYIIRPSNSAPGGWAMDYTSVNGTQLKINLGGAPYKP